MAFIEISGDFVSLENFQGKLAADWLDSDK